MRVPHLHHACAGSLITSLPHVARFREEFEGQLLPKDCTDFAKGLHTLVSWFLYDTVYLS